MLEQRTDYNLIYVPWGDLSLCNGMKKSMKALGRNKGFPGGSDGKESACNVADPGSIPGSGRSSGEENGNPLHYSCLENPMDSGA